MFYVHFTRRVPCGFLLVREGANPLSEDDADTRVVMMDWSFPGIASSMGWAPSAACGEGEYDCLHDGTDGTVDCACGLTASRMIRDAYTWICGREGDLFEDPGYFDRR